LQASSIGSGWGLGLAVEFERTGKWKRKVVFRDHEHCDNLLCYGYHEELEEKLWTFSTGSKKSLSLNFEKVKRKLVLIKNDNAIELKFYHNKRIDSDLQKSLRKEMSSL